MAELTLDILFIFCTAKMSRVKFALIIRLRRMMYSFEEAVMAKKIIICITIFSISIFSIVPILRAQYYDIETELISLDLKGMDIRDVLKILSQKSGLNIVADKDVKGAVSLYLKDVDVMDALDVLVTTNDLAYEEEGLLIRIMPQKKYLKLHGKDFKDRTKTEIVKLKYADANDIAKIVTKMKSKIGKVIPDSSSSTIVLIDNPYNIKNMKDVIAEVDVLLVTEVFSLGYGDAEAVQGKIEKMISDNVGSVKFDKRTNKIIVKDTQKKIDDIKKVIEAFDEKTRVVVIDANIIKVTLTDKYSYGIDWADIASLGDITLTGSSNLTTSLTGTTPSTLTVATATNYSTVISLLDTFGQTDVLSRPRITVADKEEAMILVGAKEVYVTTEITTTGDTYHTSDNVQFVDVGVRLVVTPEINKDGYIKLKIKPEVSDTDATKTVILTNPDGSTRSIIPYVTTSEAETTLLVKNNTTIILGGLMKDTVTEYRDKVPFLGDLPLLGKFFSTQGKSKEKTELVILLTPHIIEGDKMTKETKFYKDKWAKDTKSAQIESPEEEARRKAEDKKAGSMQKVKEPALARSTSAKVKAVKTPKKKWTRLFSKKPKVTKAKSPLDKGAYETYYMALRKEVNNISKKQDVSGKKGEVELQFSLDREGFLVRGPVVLNKPDLQLVRAAVNSVKMAIPFGAFPKGIEQKEAEFYVVVRYE